MEEVVEAASREGGVQQLVTEAVKLRTEHPRLTELNQAWKEIVFSIVSADAEAPLPANRLYRGMEYFDVVDADLFFGREQLTVELVEHLRHSSLLAIVGASGSGKSSLAHAGLIPALQGTKPLRDRQQPTAQRQRSLGLPHHHPNRSTAGESGCQPHPP